MKDLIKKHTFTISFCGINDLNKKIEKIRAAHIEQKHINGKKLKQNKIDFQYMDYGVAVDVGGLSEDQIRIVTNLDHSVVDKVYEELGVKPINE